LLIFIPTRSQAAENRSSACWRPCSEDTSGTKSSAKKQTYDCAASNSGTHFKSAVTVYVTNSYGLWRDDSRHPCQSTTPTVNGCDLSPPTGDKNVW